MLKTFQCDSCALWACEHLRAFQRKSKATLLPHPTRWSRVSSSEPETHHLSLSPSGDVCVTQIHMYCFSVHESYFCHILYENIIFSCGFVGCSRAISSVVCVLYGIGLFLRGICVSCLWEKIILVFQLCTLRLPEKDARAWSNGSKKVFVKENIQLA